MPKAYIHADAIISPLGLTSKENLTNVLAENSGIALHDDTSLLPHPIFASGINEELLKDTFASFSFSMEYTKLEKMMLLALDQSIKTSKIEITERTALIIATTKGNIDALDPDNPFDVKRAYLPVLAEKLRAYFGFLTTPIVVSNACVSGILAVAVAKRMIQQGQYGNAFVVAGDLVTRFTLAGFQSFQAMSGKPCKPYSKYRDGITLGEAAASVAICKTMESEDAVEIIGEASANDANHISGPSRTGEGLFRSVKTAMEQAGITSGNIDFISAHGTATVYNDEMEAIAFNRAGLQDVPLNSLKGYYGHTLGASGLLETIIGLHSMRTNMLHTSLGMDVPGTSKPLNVIKKGSKKEIDIFLKTASGFGGCNTSVLFKKVKR